MVRRLLPCLVVLAALASPALAQAWSLKAPFETHVHGHEFHRAVLESADCAVHFKLFFSAPDDRYRNAGGAPQYRFKARIKFHSGQTIESHVFSNDAPGERMYENS
ncbi:MAG TPA: hypothetical protein VGP93_09015, partial [Polyangiaceae bacterium]|nr:hypothetical protein [Polyangiaceae bacterium]